MGAQWMAAGFVHGVLSTDNVNVTGESFDRGPWRFLPAYDPMFIAAYFDETGICAYGRQPEALAWALVRLGGCLLPAGEERELALVDAPCNFLLETRAPFEQALFDWRGGLLSAAQSLGAHHAAPALALVKAALDGLEPAPDARPDHPYSARDRPCTMLVDEVEPI